MNWNRNVFVLHFLFFGLLPFLKSKGLPYLILSFFIILSACKEDSDSNLKGNLGERILNSPEDQTVVIDQTINFTFEYASPPLEFSLLSGAGEINPNTGEFKATEEGIIIVQVIDSTSAVGRARLFVNSKLSLKNDAWVIQPDQVLNISQFVNGGIPPYRYKVVSGYGIIESLTGIFTSSTIGNNYVEISDHTGEVIHFSVFVNELLRLSRLTIEVEQGSSVELSNFITGGVPPYFYRIQSGFGSLDPVNGRFLAYSSGLIAVEIGDTISNDLSTEQSYNRSINIIVDGLAVLDNVPINTNNTQYLSITVGGKGISRYKYKIGEKKSTNCSLATGYSQTYSVTQKIQDNISALSDGDILLCVVGQTLSGNYQAYENATQAEWTKTTTAPNAIINDHPTGQSNADSLSITISGQDVTHYKFKLGMSTNINCSLSSGYTHEKPIAEKITTSISFYGQGEVKLCVIGRNTYGNYQLMDSATQVTWIRDTIAPSLTIEENYFVSNANQVTFSGECEEGQPLTVSGSATATLDCLSGIWSFETPVRVTDGTSGYVISQSDVAGNTSTVSFSWRRDTEPPHFNSIEINSGEPSTDQTKVQVSIDINESHSLPVSYFIKEAYGENCQKQFDSATSNTVRKLSVDWAPRWSQVIGQWSFENGFSDDSGNNHHGIAHGDVGLTGSAVSGDKAVLFDGINDVIEIRINSPETNYTYSLWFRTSDPNAQISSIRHPHLGGANDRNLYLSGGNIRHRLWSEQTISSSSQNYADGNWHHVAVVVQQGVGQMVYVDSVLVASGSKDSSNFNSDTVLNLGYSSAYFNGTIDEVALWNVPLTQSEINQIYYTKQIDWTEMTDLQTTFDFNLSPGNEVKKICVWLKDNAGNATTMTPATGILGTNTEKITLNAGTNPIIKKFSVHNLRAGANFGTTQFQIGDTLSIDWEIEDAEGLSNNPINLYYTTDNIEWIPIVENYGGLTDHPLTYNGNYSSFTAPTNDYFRIKILVEDQSGNTSFNRFSDVLNVPQWSLYMGTHDRGVGAQGKRSRVYDGNNLGNFVVNPHNGDIYVNDYDKAIYLISRDSGKTTVFIEDGSFNLVVDAVLPENPKLNVDRVTLFFDQDGYLYLSYGNSTVNSGNVYQIDLKSKWVKHYLGGGTEIDESATKDSAYVWGKSGAFDFDESNSLYYFTNCTPGTWDSSSGLRLMKATQSATKSVNNISIVAGNCVRSGLTGDGPYDALTSPIGDINQPELSSIQVWNNGAVIYYAYYSGSVHKILSGQIYKTDLSVSSNAKIAYDPYSNTLYSADTEVKAYTPNLLGARGEVFTSHIASTGLLGCNDDGINRSEACVNSTMNMEVDIMGRLYFMDGPSKQKYRPYRVRYIDQNDQIQTAAGSLPFEGNGDLHYLAQGNFSGLYYKTDLEPNQAAFPEGLYFFDRSAMVLGYVDPTTQSIDVIVGNQLIEASYWPTGTPADASVSLGGPYSGGDGQPFTFDNQGLPWFRYLKRAGKLDENRQFIELQTNNNKWDLSIDGDNPSSFYLSRYGGRQNFTLFDQSLILIGAYSLDYAIIQRHDFNSLRITDILRSTADEVTEDTSIPGSVLTANLPNTCRRSGPCYTHYDPLTDRLCYSEQSALRYITDFSDPSLSTLQTLFTQPQGRNIYNYIFSQNGTFIIYMAGGNQLYCHDISSGHLWCNDSALGPPSLPQKLLDLNRGPNQFSWKSVSELFISSFNKTILLYTLPQ